MGGTPEPTASVTRERLPSLTSLRWFAASAVFLRHVQVTPNLADQGAVGVSFFFILSGFVLTWSYRERQSKRDFLVRRGARIYPSYALVAVLAIPVLYAVSIITTPAEIAKGLFNLTLLQAWIPNSTYYYAGNGVSWSLSDEAFFYVMFPFLVVPLVRASARANGTKVVATITVALIAVAIAVPLILHPSGDSGFRFWFVYINPAFRIVEFMLGMCLANLQIDGRLPRVPLWPCEVLVLVAFVLAGVVPHYAMWTAATLIPFLLLIVAAVQADIRGETGPVLGHRILITLGTWSFAFYLVHTVVIAGIRGLVDKVGVSVPKWSVAVVCYVVAIVASAVLYKVVEHPSERWLKGRFLSRRTPVAGQELAETA